MLFITKGWNGKWSKISALGSVPWLGHIPLAAEASGTCVYPLPHVSWSNISQLLTLCCSHLTLQSDTSSFLSNFFLSVCLFHFFHRHYAISELCSFEALYAFNFVFSQEESYNLIYKKTIQWKKFLPKNVTHCTQGTYNYINLYRPVFHYSNIVLVHMYNACITFSFPLPLKNICSWFDNHDSCSKCIVWFLVYPVFSSNSYLICLTTLRWSVKVFPCCPVF